MQKKLIALAIAAISAAPAFAQSNVTVYGRVDYGYMSRGSGSGAVDVNGSKGEMASGMQAGSRVGFRGTEDLGNGMKAIFQLESGVANDAAASGVAGIWSGTLRNAYVGLTGKWGTFVGGRLDGVRYGIYNKYDAFGGGSVGNFTQMTLQVDRADNAIAYVSPNWNGFGLVLAHSRDTAGNEVAGAQTLNSTNAVGVKANASDGRLYTIKGSYENGPISIDLDYETIRYASSNALLPAGNVLDNQVVYAIAGSYDFGMIKVRALWDHHEAEGSNNFKIPGVQSEVADYDAWFISATMPVGNFLLKATYGQIDDNRNAAEKAAAGLMQGDASKWGLGVNYNLSKRTNVYVDYGHISNDRTANYQISPAANSQQTGYGTSGWNVGLAHNF